MRTMTVAKFAIPGLVVLYCVAAIGGVAPSSGSRREDPSESQALASANALADAVPRSDAWYIGERRSYRVSLQMDDGSLKPAARVEAELVLAAEAYAREAAKTYVRCELRVERFVEAHDGAAMDRAAEVGRALRNSFDLELDERQGISAISLPHDLDAGTHELVRALAAELQFVGPEAGSPARWVARERDARGIAMVDYRVVEPRHYEKQRSGYESVASPRRVGRADVTMDAAGRIASVDSHYEDRSALGDRAAASRTKWHFELTGVSRSSLAQPAAGVQSWQLLSTGPSRAAIDAQVASRQSLDDVLSALERATDAAERARYVTLLESLVRSGGAKAAHTLAEAVVHASTDRAAQLLVAALEGAFTEPAQHELTELAQNTQLSLARRGDVLVHLGFGAAPTATTLQKVAEIATDRAAPTALRNGALLALGGAVRRVDRDDDAATLQAEQAVSQLSERLAASSDTGDQMTLIHALGNAGQREALPALEASLRSEQAPLRAASVQAMRHLPGDDVDTLIADRMLTDGSASVRAAAATIYRARTADDAAADALRDAMLHDVDSAVRKAAMSSALRVIQQDDAHAIVLTGALQTLSQSEADPGLRAFAVQGLGAAHLQGDGNGATR